METEEAVETEQSDSPGEVSAAGPVSAAREDGSYLDIEATTALYYADSDSEFSDADAAGDSEDDEDDASAQLPPSSNRLIDYLEPDSKLVSCPLSEEHAAALSELHRLFPSRRSQRPAYEASLLRAAVARQEAQEESEAEESEAEMAGIGDGALTGEVGRAEAQFFDPSADEKDAQWVEEHRECHGTAPETDASLSCPCCFTPLCDDCQRHEDFDEQFRAMFVRNCFTDESNRYFPEEMGTEDDAEYYHLVHCGICNEVVGTRGSNDVYIFYNVLSS